MVIPAQLVDKSQTKAQRLLTERLARQEGLLAIPVDETGRILADIAPSGKPYTEAQVQTLGSQTGADIVFTGIIRD